MSDTQSSITPEFSDYLAALKRRRMLLMVVALPILACALALAIGMPDIFVSTGLITFSDATVSGAVPTDKDRVAKEKYMDEYVDGLAQSVLSPATIDKLLDQIPGLIPAGTSREDAVSEVIRKTTVDTVKVPVLDPDSGRERQIISAFTVSFDSRDPAQSQKVAAWLTDAFLLASRSSLQVRAKAASAFYTKETDKYRDQIAQAEGRLAQFKAKNFGQLPELTDLNLNLMDRTQRDLDDVGQQIRMLQQDKIFAQQQLEQARAAGTDEGLLSQLQAEYDKKLATYDANYPDMIALRRQIDALKAGGSAVDSLSLPAQLQAQKSILAQARQRYGPEHPDIKRIERTIKTLETRIASGETNAGNPVGSPAVVQLRTQINAMDTQVAGLQKREAELRDKRDQMERRVEATPQVEREYKTLTRDLELAHAQYDQLQKSQMDSELSSAAIASGHSDELRLVQAPSVPARPSKPKRTAIAAIGLMLATLFGLTSVVFAESMDQSVRGSRDVRRVLALAPLGVIPVIRDASSARKQRWRVAMLSSGVAVVSAVVVVTVRSFY